MLIKVKSLFWSSLTSDPASFWPLFLRSVSNPQTAPWYRPVKTAALCSETNPVRADWVKTTEHFNILGREESICSSPLGKTLSSTFSGFSLYLYSCLQIRIRWQSTSSSKYIWLHEIDKNLLVGEDFGGGMRLLFIVLNWEIGWFLLWAFSLPQWKAAAQRSCKDAAAAMKALFPLSRTRSDWLLLACTIHLTSLSSHSACVHILCVLMCVSCKNELLRCRTCHDTSIDPCPH